MEINSFVSLDFEYLPRNRHIVQIGYVVVVNGCIVKKVSQLVKPACTQSEYNNQHAFINLTGITYDMVCNAPSFAEVWPDLFRTLNNNIVIAHNACSADLAALTKELDRIGVTRDRESWPTFDCYCTLELSRAIRDELGIDHCGLNHMCNCFNIPLNHHDACSDALATALLFLEINHRFKVKYKPIKYNCEYIVHSCCHPDDSTSGNKDFVNSFIQKNNSIRENKNIILEDVQEILEAPIVDLNCFRGDVVVLTGLSKNDKEYLTTMLTNIGASVKSTISQKTTCIIAGQNAGWSKIERAIEAKITIINRKDIIV